MANYVILSVVTLSSLFHIISLLCIKNTVCNPVVRSVTLFVILLRYVINTAQLMIVLEQYFPLLEYACRKLKCEKKNILRQQLLHKRAVWTREVIGSGIKRFYFKVLGFKVEHLMRYLSHVWLRSNLNLWGHPLERYLLMEILWNLGDFRVQSGIDWVNLPSVSSRFANSSVLPAAETHYICISIN
jgi:hypothetical protein